MILIFLWFGKWRAGLFTIIEHEFDAR